MSRMTSSWAVGLCAAVLMAAGGMAVVHADHDSSSSNYALSFANDTGTTNARDALLNPQYAYAPLVTRRTDNMSMDVSIDWAGPGTTKQGLETVFYNGDSACSGWGIILDETNRSIGVLVGGVPNSGGYLFSQPGVLDIGQWQRVEASRIGGHFRLRVNGVTYRLSGTATPYPLGTMPACVGNEVTIVGSGTAPLVNPDGSSPDAFNGEIDNARIVVGAARRADDGHAWGRGGDHGRRVDNLASWLFNEGSGIYTYDTHGLVMLLQDGPTWVAGAPDHDRR